MIGVLLVATIFGAGAALTGLTIAAAPGAAFTIYFATGIVVAGLVCLWLMLGSARSLDERTAAWDETLRGDPRTPAASPPQGRPPFVETSGGAPVPTWRSAPAKHGEPDPERVFLAGPWQKTRDLTGFLSELGYDLDICDDLDTALAILKQDQHSRWRFLVVDMGSLGETENLHEIVNDLVVFRQHVPAVPVVIVSATVSRDDLGTHRLPIADVTLRSPVSPERLREA